MTMRKSRSPPPVQFAWSQGSQSSAPGKCLLSLPHRNHCAGRGAGPPPPPGEGCARRYGTRARRAPSAGQCHRRSLYLVSQGKAETRGAVMKVFVAGATGVLGRELVPQLVAQGPEGVGMTRSTSKQDLVRSLGARPVVVDALDPDAVAQAVATAEPEVIVHELTALSGKMSIRDARHPDRSPMAKMTNRLRTEATDHLLAAGRAVGARRFVAQSFGAFR